MKKYKIEIEEQRIYRTTVSIESDYDKDKLESVLDYIVSDSYMDTDDLISSIETNDEHINVIDTCMDEDGDLDNLEITGLEESEE